MLTRARVINSIFIFFIHLRFVFLILLFLFYLFLIDVRNLRENRFFFYSRKPLEVNAQFILIIVLLINVNTGEVGRFLMICF